MKKKRLLLITLIMALLPLSSLSVNAENDGYINLEVGYIDPNLNHDDENRAPIFIPHVGIDGNTLSFYTPCDGRALRLLDEDENVVYSTIISVGTSTLMLPSYLSGIYRIEIIQGAFCFWGFIEL